MKEREKKGGDESDVMMGHLLSRLSPIPLAAELVEESWAAKLDAGF